MTKIIIRTILIACAAWPHTHGMPAANTVSEKTALIAFLFALKKESYIEFMILDLALNELKTCKDENINRNITILANLCRHTPKFYAFMQEGLKKRLKTEFNDEPSILRLVQACLEAVEIRLQKHISLMPLLDEFVVL